MTRTRLLDLLRRASVLSAGQRIVLAGSQAYFAADKIAPDLVQRSEEADLLLVGVERSLFIKIEEALGMESAYLKETGVFAHPLGLGTITVPRGWDERLVPFGREEGLENVWALEIHDLAASKLMAGREKDFEFLHALLDRSFCDFQTFLARFDLLRTGAFANAVPDRLKKLAQHLRQWKRDDLAREIELRNP